MSNSRNQFMQSSSTKDMLVRIANSVRDYFCEHGLELGVLGLITAKFNRLTQGLFLMVSENETVSQATKNNITLANILTLMSMLLVALSIYAKVDDMVTKKRDRKKNEVV